MAQWTVDLKSYARIVGEDNVRTIVEWRSAADDRWHAPDLVVAPRNTEEVAAIVRQAGKDQIPLIPAGGGTGYSGGVTSREGGLVLDTRRMRDILSVDAVLGLAKVQAGITVCELNDALAPEGLWWPHDPGSRGVATVGGTISVRGIGTFFSRYGAAPDTVYGVTAVLGDGTVFRIDPRPRNQAGGYDLGWLLVAAEGTLAVIAEVAVKVWRRPQRREVRLIGFDNLETVEAFARTLLDSGLAPESFMVESRDRLTYQFEWGEVTPDHIDGVLGTARWVAILAFAGNTETIGGHIGLATKLAARHGGAVVVDDVITRAYWARKTEKRTLERTSQPSYHAADISMPGLGMVAIDRVYRSVTSMFNLRPKGLRFYVSWPAGETICAAHIFYNEHDPHATARAHEWTRAMAHEAAALGGAGTSFLGVGVRLVKDLPADRGDDEIRMMRRVKGLFDPLHIMNPGKLLPLD